VTLTAERLPRGRRREAITKIVFLRVELGFVGCIRASRLHRTWTVVKLSLCSVSGA
jgi:hypothetical protein